MDKKEKNNFKTVPATSKVTSSEKKKSGFGKSVVLPFFSGVLGCAVVVGTCFGIPSIRQNILGTNQNSRF